MKMKKKLLLSVLVLVLLLTGCGQPTATPTAEPEPAHSGGTSKGVYPGETWREATTPEQLGWSSEKLAKAREYSERIGSAAVMIVDDGVVVDAWGDITRKYQCHSMRKSLLSALYGIHVASGKIDISKTLKELGIDDHTPLTEAEKQATVADLLRARSGVYIPAAGEAPSMKAMRPERGSHAPGTFWYYNNWDFNALGTIFDQETGEENIYQAFKTRIADPIGMQDFPIESLRYEYESYSMHPYYGFRMSARDLARFGLLFLREGRWRDQQIISADWVRESTASHSERGPDSGYGYMWWTGVNGGLFPNVQVKEHSFYASGYRGHRVIVLPYRNLVIVHRVNTDGGEVNLDDAQIGLLLWLILDAAGETEIGEPPFIESAKGVRLTADNLQETLAGSTARGASGSGELVVSFSEEGTVPVSVGGALIDTGKWWVEGDKLCVQFTSPDLGGGGCGYVVLDGTTIKLFDLDGTLERKLEYSPGPVQTFEREVERLREELNIPGLSVAVLRGQEVVFARGFGYADVENQIPATETTPYYIASCTKPFAVAVLMKLVEAGQLDLDAAMAGILNDTAFPFPSGTIHGYAGLCETIIELSKDPSGPYAPYRSLFEDYRCDTEPITVRHHLTHTSQGTPGEAYRYNGFLYGLLSWVAEAASGKSFADLLVEYITGPLEMTNTIPNSSDSRQQVLTELAKPYQIDDEGNAVLSNFTQDLNAGAGMISTVLDLAKFDVAMDRNLIISEESKEAMFNPTLSNSGQPLPYGMGWFVQEHQGVRLIWHYGQQTTYSSLISKVPEEELTLILLANSDGASAPFDLGAGNVLTSPFAATFLNLFTDVAVPSP